MGEEVPETAPVPLPTKTRLAGKVVAPVPPLPTGKVPVTSAARSMRAVATKPAVALRKPDKEARERVFVTRKEVEVALVVVALLAVKSCRVVEPREEREPAGKTKEPEPKVPPVMVEAA